MSHMSLGYVRLRLDGKLEDSTKRHIPRRRGNNNSKQNEPMAPAMGTMGSHSFLMPGYFAFCSRSSFSFLSRLRSFWVTASIRSVLGSAFSRLALGT